MAGAGSIEIPMRLTVEEDTLQAMLGLLNEWQKANPRRIVALVPAGDRYRYEVITLPEGNRVPEKRGNEEEKASGE